MRKLPIFLACMLILTTLLVGMTGAGAEDNNTGGDSGSAAMPEMTEEDLAAAADEALPEEGDAQEDEEPSATPTPTPMPTAAPVVNTSLTIEPELGYDGLVTMGRWTPTFVTVTNEGADFDGMLGVNVFSRLTEYDRYEIPFTIAAGATKRIMLPIKPMTRQDMYAFELTQDGKIIAEKRVSPSRMASPENVTIGVLSQAPEALAYLNQRANGLDTLRGEVWTTIPLTPDTFPTTSELMSAFSMLVVDGVDMRTLTAEQQQSLAAWLLKGGFVMVSGGAEAATGYPFFSTWTDLSAGKLAEAEDITPALLAYATIKGQPTGETIWLSALPNEGAVIRSATGDTLVTRHAAGSGLIFTMAFDLGDKGLSTWTSMTSIIPRTLRQNASTEYMQMLNRAEESRYGYNDAYQAREILNNMSVRNDESGIPVLLLLLAYLLIVGFGGYFLLKRLDRREWMWGAAPVTAVVFALILFLISRNSTINDPVALTASRVIFEADDAQMNTFIGVATPNSGELLIETDQLQLPEVVKEDAYWYDDGGNADRLYRPVNMRQRYRLGANPAVGFPSADAWEAQTLKLSSMQREVGTLEASVWMEKDGLHGKVINGTDYTFKNSLAVTAFGFVDVGDVLPGQTVPFAMLYPSAPVDQTAPDFKPKSGIMYSTLDLNLTAQTGYYDNSIYSYLNAGIYGTAKDAHEDTERRQRMSLAQMFEQDWSFYENMASFYFFGFNDTIGQVSVSLNQVPVTRTAHTAIVGSKMAFEPIGPTGEVMYPQGVIAAEILLDQGDDKKARPMTEDDPESTNNNNYYNTNYLTLSGPTAIRFMLPRAGEYEITKMTLAGMSYESMPTMYLYNNETEAWDEQLLLSVSMDGEKWAPYIDDEGGIYVRYVPAEGANRYEGMSMPTIALKGEVK